MTEHDGRGGTKPAEVRRLDDREPLRCGKLVRAEHGAYVVVEDFGGGARQAAEPGAAQPVEIIADGQAEAGGAVVYLQRRERMNMDVADGALGGFEYVEIGGAGVARVDAALHADFGGAAIPRLADAALDLVAVEVVGRPAQGVAEPALGESAEP